MAGAKEAKEEWRKACTGWSRGSIPICLGTEEEDCYRWEGYEERSIPGQYSNSGYWEGIGCSREEKAGKKDRLFSNSNSWSST
jgi:hypothetical protein